MDFTLIWNFLAEHAVELVTSTGLVGVYMMKENRRTVSIENDRKVISECYEHIDRIKREMSEMETRYEKLLNRKDEEIASLRERIAQLEQQVNAERVSKEDVETKLHALIAELETIKQKRSRK